MRTVCSFYHPFVRQNLGFQPAVRENLGFHWDQHRQPPPKREEMMTSTRKIPSVPVRLPGIVTANLQSRKEFPDLCQSLKGFSLD